MTTLTVDDIISLYRLNGARQYGRETVSQLEHALQCAYLAETHGAPPSLIAASFLHDIDHMVGDRPGTESRQTRDQRELSQKGHLSGLFGFVADSFVHNIEHMLVDANETDKSRMNDLHEHRAQWFLRGLFDESVLEPIKLHVDAKRYLCSSEIGYWETLSPESKYSLELQGGKFDSNGAKRFTMNQYSEDAVLLRRWDDKAKVPGQKTPSLEYYGELLRKLRLETQGVASEL